MINIKNTRHLKYILSIVLFGVALFGNCKYNAGSEDESPSRRGSSSSGLPVHQASLAGWLPPVKTTTVADLPTIYRAAFSGTELTPQVIDGKPFMQGGSIVLGQEHIGQIDRLNPGQKDTLFTNNGIVDALCEIRDGKKEIQITRLSPDYVYEPKSKEMQRIVETCPELFKIGNWQEYDECYFDNCLEHIVAKTLLENGYDKDNPLWKDLAVLMYLNRKEKEGELVYDDYIQMGGKLAYIVMLLNQGLDDAIRKDNSISYRSPELITLRTRFNDALADAASEINEDLRCELVRCILTYRNPTRCYGSNNHISPRHIEKMPI